VLTRRPLFLWAAFFVIFLVETRVKASRLGHEQAGLTYVQPPFLFIIYMLGFGIQLIG
jgi:hypothetical protein